MRRAMSRGLGDEESLRKRNEEHKESWRDRVSGIPLPELKVFDIRMRKPAWWRLIARRRWRRQLSEAQADLYGPVVPGTRAPEPPGVEERLPRCEAERREQRGRMDACECRTLGLDAPSLKASCDQAENRIHYLEKRVEKAVRPEPETERNPLGICGLRAEMFGEWVGARQRIDVLEARLERIDGGRA